MRKFDLNADLGEGESASRLNAIMRWIHSANVACGGHAGCPDTMERAIRSARQHGVRLGAHPGLWSRGGEMGRKVVSLKPGELSVLLLHQVGGLHHLARREGATLRHIKLHGALYHMTESDSRLAKSYVDAVARWWPRLTIYAMAGGRVARLARARNLTVWEEAFLDRAYKSNGSLVPRMQEGAVLTSTVEVMERLEDLGERGMIRAVDGTFLAVAPRTLCIHSDTGNAVRLARRAAEWLSASR